MHGSTRQVADDGGIYLRARLIRPRQLPPARDGYFWIDDSITQNPKVSFKAWCAYLLLEGLTQRGEDEPALSDMAYRLKELETRVREGVEELQGLGLAELLVEEGDTGIPLAN